MAMRLFAMDGLSVLCGFSVRWCDDSICAHLCVLWLRRRVFWSLVPYPPSNLIRQLGPSHVPENAKQIVRQIFHTRIEGEGT